MTIQDSTPIKTSKDIITNPKSELDKDAFLKLFLKQLEMQDPTNPMDTDKMLEQTSYLSTMEMNKNMQDSLSELTNTLNTTSKMNTISAIGKIANIDEKYINVTDEDKEKEFKLYFKDDIKNGEIIIKDKNGNQIKTISLENQKGGLLNFKWDLTDQNSNRVKSDTYQIIANYKNNNNESLTTSLGIYPIESIKFENNQQLAKLGGKYIPFDKIKEIYEANK